MASFLSDGPAPRLERSCGPGPADWIRIAPAAPGLERIEGRFARHGFDPHRHDTYAIGLTLTGVQSFRYRGAGVHSLPGQVFVLHPDETHDGRAGTGAGFGFRTLYVDPGAIGEALEDGHRPLPFVPAAVSNDPGLTAAVLPALADLDRPLAELECLQIILDLADRLAAADRSRAARAPTARHRRAVAHARDLIEANLRGGVGAAALEQATGLSRYALARHFRACLGTSPHRYLLLRRLDRVRALLRSGMPLAEAALAAGFADQSHMSRQFKRSYGLSPGRWAALSARG